MELMTGCSGDLAVPGVEKEMTEETDWRANQQSQLACNWEGLKC